jgi:hypothetical protein
MSDRYPRLVAKYGYKDSSWSYLKVQTDLTGAALVHAYASWHLTPALSPSGCL